VAGVRVGHATLIWGEEHAGARSRPGPDGVTVILLMAITCSAQGSRWLFHTINGYGKPFGFEQVRELGS